MRAELIAAKSMACIFIPAITTDSSSRSAWIWPPSDFTVSLDCRATDGAGKMIWETSLKAEAHLPLPEVYRDHSRAGKEAIKEAFVELQNRIVKSGAFR